MSDGVIPQIERYCDKYLYNVLASSTIDDVMASMVEKSASPTGNLYAVMCNERSFERLTT